ncbi:MAG: autotransporter domain-containing protein [Endomicrobium sp.]|nr:autotransporter domain-containing protein [Endomicrobium sp.]
MAVNLNGNTLSFSTGSITLSGSDKGLSFTNGGLFFNRGSISNSAGAVINFSRDLITLSNNAVNGSWADQNIWVGTAIRNHNASIGISDSVLYFIDDYARGETDRAPLSSISVVNNYRSGLTINRSDLHFSSNHIEAVISQNGAYATGATILNIFSTMTITASTMTFSYNYAAGASHNGNNGVDSAGQISNLYSFMEITDSLLGFNGNTAEATYSPGGLNGVVSGILLNYNYGFGSGSGSIDGFYLASLTSTMTIKNSVLIFTDNYSLATPRAFTNYNYLHGVITNAYRGANMIFEDSRINITSNTARGILNFNGGKMDFINTDIDIIDNSAEGKGDGGGILNLRYIIEGTGDHSEEIDAHNISEIRFVNGNINFVNNIADNGSAIANKDHGAIYTPTTPVSITFSSSSVSFSMHGGNSVIYNRVTYDRTHDAIINFINSDVKFTTNTATLLYNNAGTINFLYSTAAFFNTSITGNGAVINNMTNSTVTFTGGNAMFANNSASGLGGAIFNEGTITFSSSSVSFLSHAGNYVIYNSTDNARIDFINSNVEFATNTATLMYNNAGEINFLNGSANFFNNSTTGNGAVINNMANSTITFTGGNAMFANNSASGLGGAIYNEGTINLNTDGGSITFSGNTASSAANDIHNTGIINISGSSGDITINSGISGNGIINKDGANFVINADGAGYAGNFSQTGGTTTVSNGFFNGTNNISGGTLKIEDGGYLNAQVYFSTSAVLNINNNAADFNLTTGTFAGNMTILKTGMGILNLIGDFDSYTGQYNQEAGTSTVSGKFFGGENTIRGGVLKFNDGAEIMTQIRLSTDAVLNVANSGTPFMIDDSKLSGWGKILKTDSGTLNIFGNINNFNGTIEVLDGTIKIKDGHSIDIEKLIVGDDGRYDMINDLSGQQTYADEALIKGEIALDVDLETKNADMIKAILSGNGSGRIEIDDTTSRLKLNIFGQTNTGGQLRITLLEAQGGRTGEFFSNSLEEAGLAKLGPGVKNYSIEYKSDGVDLIALLSTDHGSIANMTHNQKEIASAIDYITQSGSIQESFEKMVYDDINNLSDANKKKAFDELSGSIIANSLSQGAINYAGNQILDRIYPSSEGETGNTVWTNIYGYGNRYNEDENSPSDFKMNGYGIRGGADIFNNTEYAVGIYAGYADTDMKQGKNKGNMKDMGMGVYGGKFGDKTDIKGQIYMGMLNYDIVRNIGMLGRQARSEFTAYGTRIEAVVEYFAYSQDLFDIKPYAAIKGGYVLNPEIEEEGGQGAGIKIYSGDYIRAEAAGGVEISGGIGRINWHGKLYTQYLITGEKGEYDGEFAGSKKEMNIWGVKDKSLGLGAIVGGDYIINENFDTFVNLQLNYGEMSSGYYASAGINYRFLKNRQAIKKEKKEQKIKKEAQEIINIVISERNILEVWEIEGDREWNAKITKEIADKLWLEEGETIYEMGYGGRIFFFNDEDKKKRFREELLTAGAKNEEIKEAQSYITGEKISFVEYIEEIGDMSEGSLIIKYSKGIAEIKNMPEEAKRVKRDEIISRVLEDSQVSVIIKTKEDGDSVIMTKESGERLGIMEGSKIYLVHYGNRLFLFKDRQKAGHFIEELNGAGAQLGEENIREIEGVYIKDEVMIKKEDVKELGDLSKGIVVEEYKQDVEEMKSLAQEEERKKREEINKEKIKEAEKRREKPVIKAYKLNIANFGTNEYELTEEAKETIRNQAKEIREYDYKKITVEGHADSVGRDEVNQKISKKRGEVVYREFLINGIPAEKISYIGFGSTIPIESNSSDEGRAANRRTEIFVE